DGQELQGYLATPAKTEGAPAVVVIQEWWGLNDQIRGVADRLARCGYFALVPDLYRGKSTVEEEEANHLMTGLYSGDAAARDLPGARTHLTALASGVAETGDCMGGALPLRSLQVADADAGVTWYGYPPLDYLDPAKLKVPLMGHWSTQDAL
ncbi:dienelactone hydrolase family protein, partial [Pseudomonas sp. MWU12-2534b]